MITLSYIEKKHWRLEPNATVQCYVVNDGFVVMFDYADVAPLLNSNYPHTEGYGQLWFFNETRDREIAERRADRVYANPQVLWRHFQPSKS